jgi:hypothetical protein
LAVKAIGVDRIVGTARDGVDAAKAAVGLGADSGVIGVRNETDRDLACQVRCRTRSETAFDRQFAIPAGGSGQLGSVPGEAFQIAVRIQNGPSAKRTFEDPGTVGSVAIRITPDGLRIE